MLTYYLNAVLSYKHMPCPWPNLFLRCVLIKYQNLQTGLYQVINEKFSEIF
jgi:hypothetical protein